MKEDEETIFGPWLEHSTSLGWARTLNGEATPTKVSQTDNCE